MTAEGEERERSRSRSRDQKIAELQWNSAEPHREGAANIDGLIENIEGDLSVEIKSRS